MRGPSSHGMTGSASLPPDVFLPCSALSVRGSAVVTGAAESAVISQPALCLTRHTQGMCGQGGGLVWNCSGEGQSSVRGLARVCPAEAGLQAPCRVRVKAPLGSGSQQD